MARDREVVVLFLPQPSECLRVGQRQPDLPLAGSHICAAAVVGRSRGTPAYLILNKPRRQHGASGGTSPENLDEDADLKTASRVANTVRAAGPALPDWPIYVS